MRRLPTILSVLLMLGATGCQNFAPGAAATSVLASREDKKTLKQAENDPFPSPADVGLGEPTAKQ